MTRFLMLLALVVPLMATSISCDVARGQEGDHDVIIIRDRDHGGYLGVSTQDLTDISADSVKTSAKSGAYVREVVPGSPAEKAGIKKSDVIVEVNGKTIDDRWDLLKEVRSYDPGTNATLVVVRGDRRETLTATLGKAPSSPRRHAIVPDIPPAPRVPRMINGSSFGLSLMEMNDQLAAYFEAPNGHGVLVEEVEEKSPAAEAGFKAGDVIVRVGKQNVEEIDDVWSALDEFKEGEKADVEVLRKGSRHTLTLAITDEGSFHSRHRMFMRGSRFEWNSKAFEEHMKQFQERMKTFGKELEERMKDVQKKIHEELDIIRV